MFSGRTKLLLVCSSLSLAACGHISIYDNPQLTGKPTGIEHYSPKPYILVSHTGAKDKPNEVQLIYLPDLSRPRYAVMVPGIGSSKLGITLSNGMLASVNQETDAKLVEAITALAGVPGALAAASKTRAEADKLRAESTDLPVVADMLEEVAGDINGSLKDQRAAHAFLPSDKPKLAAISGQLNQLAMALRTPGAATNLDEIEAALDQAKQQLASIKPNGMPSNGDASLWDKIRRAESKLQEVLTRLKPEPIDRPSFALYEIDLSSGTPVIREVPIDPAAAIAIYAEALPQR